MIIKRKILQVTGSLRMGGVEKVAINYYKYIDKDEFEFDYLVFGDEKGDLEYQVEYLGGRVLRIPHPRKGLIDFYKNIRNILRKEGPYDVVHSHPLFISGLVMKAAYEEKVATRIAHSHSARDNLKVSLKKKVYNVAMKFYLKKYSNIFLACSVSAGNYLFGAKFFGQNGQVINNGIDLEKFNFDISIRNKVRNQLRLDKSFVLGHIGRLSDVKNQTFVLDVFNRVKQNYSDSKLILVGDGPDKRKLIKYAKNLEIYNDVIFLGTREDANELLQAMDLLLFPSKYEGLGIAILEAQVAGLRCVISDIIPKEVDVTSLNSRLSLNDDLNKWADEVLKYNCLYERENKTYDFIKNQYDMDSVMRKIREIYTLNSNSILN